MIKIKIICIGKDKDRWVSESCEHFVKLLSRYADLSLKIIPAYKISSSLTSAEIKKKEAELISKQFGKGHTIALVDTGEKYNSHSLARLIEKQIAISGGTMTFIIGGAYGLDNSILNQVDFKLSLSPLTFSHQLARVVLLEQLFRAFSIINNSDYHK